MNTSCHTFKSQVFFKGIFILLFVIGLLVPSVTGYAQIRVNVKEKLNNALNDRANQRTDEAIDAGLDGVENGVKKSVKKKNKSSDQEDEANSEEEVSTEEKTPDSDIDQSSNKGKSQKAQASLQSYSKYDFVPGDKVLFFEDFSQDAIGDFPSLWTTNGSGEVKTVNIAPGNWLHMNTEDAVYAMTKEIAFPENFIFECDVITAPKDGEDIFEFSISFFHANNDYTIDDLFPGDNGFHMGIANGRWSVKSYNNNDLDGKDGESTLSPVGVNELHHIIAWVQKGRIRIYHAGQKVIDLPTLLYTPINYNHLRFSLWDAVGRPYVTNIRITTAGADTRSKLLTEGKLVSYGIYFDVNKDVVKPESYGALNEIAKVLKENPTVRVKIAGYTDSDGADAANLDLSKRRAASVKNELVKSFGINASRLESDGFGENQPIAPNDTPANKALNRRVEFIKL